MITRWTNIKSILFELERWIPKDIYSEARLIEDCMRAVDLIGAVPTYQVKPFFTKVHNHKFCIPNDCLQIIQIAYRENPNIEEHELNEIREDLLRIPPHTSISDSHLPEQVWFDGWQIRKGWQPLRLSTDSFALAVHCENSPNLHSHCEHTYTVSPDGTITTSCKKALILMSYYAYPKDCDGVPLIPDDENYKQALINFCLMNAWEYRWNLKEEGAGERYLKYQQLWGLYKAKGTASVRMPDVGTAQNMQYMLARLIPKNRRFETFFRNLGAPEQIDFKGYTNHAWYR